MERSVEENARVRAYLSQVLESLPCGVLVVGAGEKIEIINPEARRLLEPELQRAWDNGTGLPPSFGQTLREASANKAFSEQEDTIPGLSGNRAIGISRAKISEMAGSPDDTIWILRDITEQKRIAAEREAARRAHALAEVTTVLAHEIRNPLGSLELFTALLADATAHMPETRQWITHLQAGLRGGRDDDECGGRVHQLPAQKSGHGLRPRVDSDRARCRLSNRRQWRGLADGNGRRDA